MQEGFSEIERLYRCNWVSCGRYVDVFAGRSGWVSSCSAFVFFQMGAGGDRFRAALGWGAAISFVRHEGVRRRGGRVSRLVTACLARNLSGGTLTRLGT